MVIGSSYFGRANVCTLPQLGALLLAGVNELVAVHARSCTQHVWTADVKSERPSFFVRCLHLSTRRQ